MATHSEETRARIAVSVRRWWTPARRRMQSRLVRRYWALHPERLHPGAGRKSPESIARGAATLRLRWADPEFRAMMAAAMKTGSTTRARRHLARAKLGSAHTAETREKMRRSALARWARQREGIVDTAPRQSGAAEAVEGCVVAASTGGPGGETL